MRSYWMAIAATALYACFFASSAQAQNTLDQQLYLAAEKNDTARMYQLMRQGANVNAHVVFTGEDDLLWRKQYDTPLLEAIFRNSDEAAVWLLEHGANPNLASFNRGDSAGAQCPIIIAVFQDSLEVISLLLKKHAKVDSICDSKTALIEAASCSNSDIVQLLLSKGAAIDLNAGSGTALAMAASHGSIEIVKLLLAKGAKLAAVDIPLIRAASGGNTEILQIFLDHGASVNESSPPSGFTPLYSAVNSKRLDAVKWLLGHGANLKAQNADKNQPLHLAAESGYVDIARTLLEGGAEVNARGALGRPPLASLLCSESSFSHNEGSDTAKLLLEHSADVDIKDEKGQSPRSCVGQKGGWRAEALKTALAERQKIEAVDAKPAAERLHEYADRLAKTPDSEWLRGKVIAAANELAEPPATSEAARQLFALATPQIAQAAKPEALVQPIALLRKATDLAPWWANAYYNLSRALEMSGQYDEAIAQMRHYLALTPAASADAEEARAHIVVIETLRETAHKR